MHTFLLRRIKFEKQIEPKRQTTKINKSQRLMENERKKKHSLTENTLTLRVTPFMDLLLKS